MIITENQRAPFPRTIGKVRNTWSYHELRWAWFPNSIQVLHWNYFMTRKKKCSVRREIIAQGTGPRIKYVHYLKLWKIRYGLWQFGQFLEIFSMVLYSPQKESYSFLHILLQSSIDNVWGNLKMVTVEEYCMKRKWVVLWYDFISNHRKMGP